MVKKLPILLPSLFVVVVSCRKPYQPPAITSSPSYLVVEGTIITGNTDSTVFKLSRTVKLADSTTAATETGAQVNVQDEAGRSYALTETSKGHYAAAALGLNPAGRYRLSIKRSNGSSYASDYVQSKVSSPIDSVTYRVQDEGLYIYVNSHDVSNQTRYYRWDYREDWQFHTYYQSFFVSDGTKIRPRTPAEDIYNCYQSRSSNVIVLNNTLKLAQDVVSQQLVTFVPGASEKVSNIYSIEVRQYPLSSEAYDFWQNMKRITEQTGSIFDAQPTQLTGNVHNVADAKEPVIGYISAGTVASKRIYVKRFDINKAWLDEENAGCDLYENYRPFVYSNNGSNEVGQFLIPGLYLPLAEFYKNIDLTGKGFSGTSFRCGDCTTRGVKVKPSFWPF